MAGDHFPVRCSGIAVFNSDISGSLAARREKEPFEVHKTGTQKNGIHSCMTSCSLVEFTDVSRYMLPPVSGVAPFRPESGGSTLLRNVGKLLLNCIASHPRINYSS
jgi:hypothetical protein